MPRHFLSGPTPNIRPTVCRNGWPGLFRSMLVSCTSNHWTHIQGVEFERRTQPLMNEFSNTTITECRSLKRAQTTLHRQTTGRANTMQCAGDKRGFYRNCSRRCHESHIKQCPSQGECGDTAQLRFGPPAQRSGSGHGYGGGKTNNHRGGPSSRERRTRSRRRRRFPKIPHVSRLTPLRPQVLDVFCTSCCFRRQHAVVSCGRATSVHRSQRRHAVPRDAPMSVALMPQGRRCSKYQQNRGHRSSFSVLVSRSSSLSCFLCVHELDCHCQSEQVDHAHLRRR